MGLFGNKQDGVKEFSDMRDALQRTDGPREPEADSRGSAAPLRDEKAGPTMPSGKAPAASQMQSAATAPEDCSSVVSNGSNWQGTLRLDGSVRIDGQLNGDIEARETVHISEGAQVDAKVKAAFVVIAGTFQGQVECSERLELMPSSRVQGELSTKSLTIHEGAFIDGQIHMTGTDRPARSAQVPQRRPSGSPPATEAPAATSLPTTGEPAVTN